MKMDWKECLEPDFKSDYFLKLTQFLNNEYSQGKKIFPPQKDIYNALSRTELKNVKVVILGQDPYHGAGQAHGLSFSVPEGVPLPPSLKNIYKELSSDLNVPIPLTGDLSAWADQGVLLLNSVLTVEEGAAGSHQNKGWELFTDRIIQLVDEHCPHVVFILWGNYAQKKAAFVNPKKHLVLSSVHPSPLSSHRGFFGSKPFSQTNDWLEKNGIKPIKWNELK